MYLGIVKDYEPLLLVPIGAGCMLANLPLSPLIASASQGGVNALAGFIVNFDVLRHVLGKWRRWLIRCYQCRELEAHEAAAEAARARLLLQEQDDIADSLRADIVITTVSGIKLMLYLEATGQVGDSPRAVLGGSYVGSTISSATSTAIRRWFKSPRRTDVEAELVNQALSLQAMPLQPLVQPDAPVAGATAGAMAGAGLEYPATRRQRHTRAHR